MIADASGHLTPAQLHSDLTRAGVDSALSICIYHIKPVHEKKVISEHAPLAERT